MSTILPVKKKRKRRPHLEPSFLVEKTDSYTYTVTSFGKDGWADAEKYKPIPYDLVTLHTTQGKQKNGWWADCGWDGYRIKHDDHILKWRKVSSWGQSE